MRKYIFLTSAVLLAVLPGSLAEATAFTTHDNMDLPGFDIPSDSLMCNPMDVPPRAGRSAEFAFCQGECDRNPRCMAFTWVQGAPSQCWFKSSSRLLETNPQRLMTVNTNTASGVKIYQNSPCWARHIFNLKFCNVVFAGEGDGCSASYTLECPQGARRVRNLLARASSGRFPDFCVARMERDPGGLPNCTDFFGGDANTAGVLGSYINQACLDAN